MSLLAELFIQIVAPAMVWKILMRKASWPKLLLISEVVTLVLAMFDLV